MDECDYIVSCANESTPVLRFEEALRAARKLRDKHGRMADIHRADGRAVASLSAAFRTPLLEEVESPDTPRTADD